MAISIKTVCSLWHRPFGGEVSYPHFPALSKKRAHLPGMVGAEIPEELFLETAMSVDLSPEHFGRSSILAAYAYQKARESIAKQGKLGVIWATMGPDENFQTLSPVLQMASDYLQRPVEVSLFVDSACSGSLVALFLAKLLLQRGVLESCLVGGVYTNMDQLIYQSFQTLGVLSHTQCLAFGDHPPGVIIGEGMGLFYLEKNNESVFYLEDVAINNSGKKADIFSSSTQGQRECFEKITAPVGKILVQAHATGTVHGDLAEKAAIKGHYPHATVGTTKNLIGHTMAASGAAALEAALQASMDHVAVNAFGFGGTNAHALLSRSLSEQDQCPMATCHLLLSCKRSLEELQEIVLPIPEEMTKQWDERHIWALKMAHLLLASYSLEAFKKEVMVISAFPTGTKLRQDLVETPPEVFQEQWAGGVLDNTVASKVAFHFDFQGGAFALDGLDVHQSIGKSVATLVIESGVASAVIVLSHPCQGEIFVSEELLWALGAPSKGVSYIRR